jgi:hypothetical protein
VTDRTEKASTGSPDAAASPADAAAASSADAAAAASTDVAAPSDKRVEPSAQPDRTTRSEPASAEADDTPTATDRAGRSDGTLADEAEKPRAGEAAADKEHADQADGTAEPDARAESPKSDERGRVDDEPATTVLPAATVGRAEPETVVIRRPAPDPKTEVLPEPRPGPTPTPQGAPEPPPWSEPKTTVLPAAVRAAPQRIPAAVADRVSGLSPRGKLLAGAAAAAVLLIALIIGLAVANHGSADNSPQGQIRHTISSYATALKDGDLNTLRKVTTGRLGDFYKMTPQEFNSIYQSSVRQKSIPEIDSVDAIQINGKSARAQVTASMPSNPDQKMPRSFTLTDTGDGWKITN